MVQRNGVIESTNPWAKKRHRDSTPPEELEQEHETRYREAEEGAAELATRKDSSYKAGSVSEAESIEL